MRCNLLPEWILAGLLNNLRCSKCGGRGPTSRVSRPAITLGLDTAGLELRVLCTCGARSVKRVELPVLQLGFILVHGAVVELSLAGSRPYQPELQVTPRPSDPLRQICQSYHQVVGRLVEQALSDAVEFGPNGWKDPTAGSAGMSGTCADCGAREVWDMSPAEWAQFMHRLGFEFPENDSREDSEIPEDGPKDAPPDSDSLPDLPNDAGGPPEPEKK